MPAVGAASGGGERSQRRAVAVHAEDPFGDHQGFAIARRRQSLRQALDIVMVKAAQRGGRMARRIEQRGVRQLIGDNAILLLRQQMHDRLIGGEARDKQQRARIAEPVGELRLQLGVAGAIPRDVSRRAGARRALTPAGDHRRMLAQAEIVVAGEVTVPLSLDLQRAGIVARH